jgi:hypothetical protein
MDFTYRDPKKRGNVKVRSPGKTGKEKVRRQILSY